MAQLAISLLGPPRVEVDNQPIEIRRRKAVALLAYLAVTAQPHSRDALAALLWPESSQRRAGASLRSALWALNKTTLENWLRVDAATAVLPPTDSLTTDVVQFRELLTVPQAHDHPAADLCVECLGAVETAVALYRDDFMAGFTLPDAPAFDEWQFFQANSLRELLAAALERLLRFHSARGNVDQAIAYGRRLVALDPLHEPAQHALIQLYDQAGQQAAALRQYDRYRETLAAELDADPSTTITALYDQIRTRPRDATQSPIPNPRPPIDHNLPPDPTPFVGREEELRRMAGFLRDAERRLVTIVGPGGIGKTRLALAAAAAALPSGRFPDGVYFVSLAPVTAPEAMLSLIAETVGYPLQSDGRPPAQQLLDYFRHKSLLLVLDNFEHLLAGAAFVADLLQQASQVAVLVTSRERLNLYEEQQMVLGGLAVPEGDTAVSRSDYPAAVLFLQSAQRRRPDFDLASADLPHLAEICRLVEGMPLGLELAAAWVEMLSLRQIAAEIRHNLDFLETAVRNAPARHRSMRAVFDASWQRLTEAEQRVYARLSVFQGGFTAAAAKAVAGAALKTVAALVRQSLLRAAPGTGRYEMHELLRQYTAVKLQESDDEALRVHDRHAAYYCAFLHEREADLKGARQQAALAEIEADLENAAAAWRRAAVQAQTDRLGQALVPLALFYQWNGRLREGAAMCRLAVERLNQAPEGADDTARRHLLLKLLTWQNLFDFASANYESADYALQQAQMILDGSALQAVDTKADEAFLLLQRSTAASREAFVEAQALNEQSLALYRATGDTWGVTQALGALGAKHQNLGNYERAIALQRERLAISQRLHDLRGIAKTYSSLGHYILFAGDLDASERYLRKSLALFRELNMRAGQRNPLLILGINLLFAGKFEQSIASFEACWAIHRELGMPHEPGSANVGIARAKINLGRYEEARLLSEADLVRYQSLQLKWYIAFTLFNLGRIALVEEDVAQAYDQLQQSATLLLEMNDRPLAPDVLFCLAFVHRRRGERSEAIRSIIRALQITVDSEPLNPMRFELPAMALLLLDAGETERAVELYATARQSAYIANSVWFETIAGREIARAAAKLPPDVVAAAKARGQAQDLGSTVKTLLAELEKGK